MNPMPLNNSLQQTVIPQSLGQIVDIAPIDHESSSVWLMLAEDGSLIRLEASTGEWARLGTANSPPERPCGPFDGHTLTRRLHASRNGEFAAVVNDYGRFGQVIDLRSGQVTLNLDGGDDCSEAVPFLFIRQERTFQMESPIRRTDSSRALLQAINIWEHGS